MSKAKPIRSTKRPTKKKTAAKKGLRVEYVPLGDLEHWPRNPKRHDRAGIAKSIRRWGFTLPVIVDEKTGRLVAGHGRQEVLTMMKAAGEMAPKNIRTKGDEWLVPVVRGNEFENEAEAEKYLIADNRFVELGGWDPQALSEMLDGVEGDKLMATGFDQVELDKLLKAAGRSETPTRLVQFQAKDKKKDHKCPGCGYEWSE